MGNSFAKAEAILSEITDEWDSDIMDRLLELAIESPSAVTHLLRTALSQGLSNTIYTDVAISFIPEEDFPSLVSDVMQTPKRRFNTGVVESLVEHTSLQSVTSLHPYLATLFAVSDDYSKNWPWRGGVFHLDTVGERRA